MTISKRCTVGGSFERRQCIIHQASSQEKWRCMRDVSGDIIGNLREAIKVLQNENVALVATIPPQALQAIESKRNSAIKKALNKLGRALNQLSTLEVYTSDLSKDTQSLQKRVDASEKAQMELSKQIEVSSTTMHERVKHYKNKMQETLDKLQSEEIVMANMVKELEAARKDKAVLKEQMRLKGFEQGYDLEQKLKEGACEEDLRAENEKLKKEMIVLKEKESIDNSANVASKNVALATTTIDRYKQVVAKVTADNMVLLMKMKRNEAALNSAQEKIAKLQKELDNGRAQWLEEASCEIQEVIQTSLSKAESCEAKLQELQRQQATIDKEWEDKLSIATKNLAQMATSKDWLEKTLMDTTEKYKVLEDKKSKLEQKYEIECQYRQHAEAESRALISTLQKNSGELAEVNLALGTSLKDIETQKNCVVKKEMEIEKILADLDNAKCHLETQRGINIALMKKKEEVEWELMAIEAQRAQLQLELQQKLNKRPTKSCVRSPPMASFL